MNARRLLLATAAVAGASLPATAHAVTVLPTVSHALTATGTTTQPCDTAARSGRGLASTSYTAPMSGYLTVRLRGTGDWDLLLRDGAGRAAHASQGFGGSEVVQTWIDAGETVIAEGCRNAGASPSAAVSFVFADVKPSVLDGQTASLVRVFTGLKGQAALADAGLDVTESASSDWADVIADGPKQLAQLEASGARYKVRVPDLGAQDRKQLIAARSSARSARASALPTGRTDYRTFDDIQAELKKLVADHPNLVRPVVLGKSYQGREIQGVEIASDVKSTTDGRPTFFLMGVHHAREWPSAEIAMEFAHLLAEGGSDARIKSILDNERVLIVPLVNPDGYISSRSSPEPPATGVPLPVDPLGCGSGADGCVQLGESIAPPGGVAAYRRKNCNNEDGMPSTPCGIAHGVDINRNYGNLWGGPGSSGDITSQSYHGLSPRSEPETKAVFNYALTHHVTALISLHTIAGLVLRPPGVHDGGKAPDEKALKALGDAMGAATGYTSEYSFQLYDTAGTTEDDTYAATGGYGYTIEIGPSDGLFHGPYDLNVVQQWTGNGTTAKGGMREALLDAADVAKAPASHAQLSGQAPAGMVLHLKKAFDTTTSKFCLNQVDPVVTSPIDLGDATRCQTGFQNPLTLHDASDYKTTVPDSGTFSWQIGQSTRPFVNGGAEIDKTTVVDTPVFTAAGTPGAPGSTKDFPFTAPADLGKDDKLQVHLGIAAGEDYDLEVFKADGTTSVGTSGEGPGSDEEVTFGDVTPGAQYIARVTYFAALTGQYTVTVKKVLNTVEITKGSKEAYTLTCETPAGKVLETESLVIDRGQAVSLNLGCGTGPSTDASGTPLSTATGCTLPNTAPTVGCQPVPTGTATNAPAGKLKLTLRKAARRQNLKRVLNRRFLAVRCALSAPGTCTVTAKLGKKVLGGATVKYGKARSKVVKIKLTRKALRLVKTRRGKVRFTAIAAGSGYASTRAGLTQRIKR